MIKKCKFCDQDFSSRNKYFCSKKCSNSSLSEQNTKKRSAVIQNGKYCDRLAKRYLQSVNNVCSICKIPNEWNDMPLVMILDHIDGNSEDSSIENLRLVCPNCDSQLSTFKSRNRGNGRFSRRERYSDGRSY